MKSHFLVSRIVLSDIHIEMEFGVSEEVRRMSIYLMPIIVVLLGQIFMPHPTSVTDCLITRIWFPAAEAQPKGAESWRQSDDHSLPSTLPVTE